jgi:hypothetical protein
MSTIAPGEIPTVYTTDNVRISVQKPLKSTLNSNASIQPPATVAEAQYGSLLPYVTLSSDLFDACKVQELYVQLSVMQWGVNPYPNSSEVKTSLFSIGSITEVVQESRRILATEVSFHQPTPLYFITLQFEVKQDFGNYSYVTLNDIYGNATSNFTIPECTFNDGTAYVPCQGCNISSFTEYNATYGCYDASQLCSGVISKESNRDLRRYVYVQDLTSPVSNPITVLPHTDLYLYHQASISR